MHHLVGIKRSVLGGAKSRYLVLDKYSDTIAAGSVNGTDAVPGPGVRTVTDTENKLSLSSGRLQFAGGKAAPTFGEPGIWFTDSFVRNPGLVFGVLFNADAANTICGVGFDDAKSALANKSAFYINNNSSLASFANGVQTASLISLTAATPRHLAVVIRDGGGAFYLTKLEASSAYDLVWVDDTDTTDPVYAGITNYNLAGWLDNAFVSTWGGNWKTQWGLATFYDATPTANDTATATADGIFEMSWDCGTGETLEISIRRTDDNNRIVIRADEDTNTIKIIKIETGGEAEENSAAQVFNDGTSYRIVVTADGNAVRSYVNGAWKNQDVALSFNNTETGTKVAGFASGSNFAAWPRQAVPPF